MTQIKYLAIFFLCLFSCKNKIDATKETDKPGPPQRIASHNSLPTININWGKVPINSLPYGYEINKDFTKEQLLKVDTTNTFIINTLFSDSTFLEYRYYNDGHPNNLKGFFLKRLPNIDDTIKVLLFTYWDKKIDGKVPSIELQTYDNSNHLIDKLIVVDGIIYEGGWQRKFASDKNYIITINDNEFGKQSNHNNSYKYKIKGNGKIVRYWPNINNSEFEEIINPDYGDNLPKIKSKGKIINHMKEDKWQETTKNKYSNIIEVGKLINSIGSYYEGEKDGEWIYFELTSETLLYGEKYKNGKLIERTTDDYKITSEYADIITYMQKLAE